MLQGGARHEALNEALTDKSENALIKNYINKLGEVSRKEYEIKWKEVK